MNERSKKFIEALNADFRALSNETRKKFFPVKEAAEAGILKLRNIPAVCQNDQDIYRVLSEENEIMQPFLLGCDTKSLRVVQISLTALQRLVSHQAISEASAGNLISALWFLMDHGLEELRILQTLLLILTTTKIVTGDSLSKAIVLCFKLYFAKDPTISSTAAASVRQIVSAVFERVVNEDTTDNEDDADAVPVKPSSPRHKNCPVSLRPLARDAYLLYQDLCQLTSGEQPYWLVGMDEMMRTFGLELLENVLKSFPNIFLKHPEFSFLLKERVCPLVIKLFSPSIKFRQGPNATSEPPLEKPVFPVSMRLLRIVSVLIEQFYTLLVTECEIFLSLLVKFLDIDKPFWQRSLALEVLHILCLQPKLLRSFCQYYDMQEHSTKVFHDLVNSLASFIQSLYSGAGQQSFSSSTPPHSPTSTTTTTSHQSTGANPTGNGSTPVPGFQYHGVWLPLVKLPAGQAKPVCLDQLDRVDTPSVSEAYAMTVAFKTLLALVGSIDALVKSTSKKEGVKVEGWIEPKEDVKTPDKTGVGTEAVERDEAEKESELNEVWKQMLNSSWCGLLAALSLLLEASNDEGATEGILKCYQILANSCGLLDLTFPRDAFIMSMCKASLPSQCSLSVLSIPSLNSDSHSAAHHHTQEHGASNKPSTKSSPGSTTSSFPTVVAGLAQGAHNGPVSLSSKNIRCMRAILTLSHCHGGVLGSSWYILLATLKHLTWMLGLRPGENGSLKPGPINEIPNLVVSSSLKTEIPVLSAMLSRLFESSRFLDDVAVHHLIEALCRLMSEAADQAETSKDPSLFPIAKLLETGLHNLHRIPVLWKPLIAHLLEVCQSRHTRMREYGAEAVTSLVCAALEFDHKPPLVANSQLQGTILSPLQDMSTNTNSDVRNRQLECVLQILQSIGQNLGTGWPVILGVVGAATNQISSAIIQAGFQSLQLVVTDFLPMMPFSNLQLVIEVAGKYGLQPQELNISLTAVGLLWNISDFLNQHGEDIREALEQLQSQNVEPPRDDATSLPVLDRLWMAIYSKMGELCVDPRPAVRKSAGQTLFSTISAHGSLLEKKTWYTVLWQVLFPLLERVKTMSSAAASVPPPSDTTNQGRILMHHSRDTAEKQWDETRVLSLNGVARVFNTRRQLLASLDEFPRAWALLLEFIEAAALSKSSEVSLAALKSFLDIVQDPTPDDEAKQSEAVFNEKSGNFVSKGRSKLKVKPKFCEESEDINLWINAWRVWHNIGVTSTSSTHTLRVKKDSNGQAVKYKVYPNQPFLTALIDVFPYLFPRTYSRFGLSDLQKLSQVILFTLKVPVHIDSAPFLTTMNDSVFTPLQTSISNVFDLLREPISGHGSVLDNSSQPMYPTLFTLLSQIVGFASQALVCEEPDASGAGSRKKEWIIASLVVFSERCLERLVDLYKVCADNESVIQDRVVYNIIKTLHVPLKLKYSCQRQTTWKLAINSLIVILETGLPVAYKDTRLELFSSMWEEIAGTFEDFLFTTSNPPDTQTMDDHLNDEKLDLKVLKVIREDILPHSHILPRDFLSRIMTLLNKGSIHSATNATLEGLDGSKFPLREEFAKSCFETLLEFSFSSGNEKGVQKEAKVSQLAIDSLLGRCKEVLSKYTEDDKLGGKCPLPRTRMAEVTFVIKAMATLVSSLKKTSSSPSCTYKVDPKLWSQVVDIYPCLVDCITCSSDAVRDALKQTLFEFKDLLLHEPNHVSIETADQ